MSDKKVNQNDLIANFSILVSNYPPFVTPDSIIEQIKTMVRITSGREISIKKGFLSKTFFSQEFSIILPNEIQFNSVYALNGQFIFNSKIWIIRFPFRYLSLNINSQLSKLIHLAVHDGVLDFGNLRNQFFNCGIDPNLVNFDDLSFVEYLFYSVGSQARDNNFLILQMNATNNNIHDVNWWHRYLHFMPALRFIDVTNNPLVIEPEIDHSFCVQIIHNIKQFPSKPKPQNSDEQVVDWNKVWMQNSLIFEKDKNKNWLQEFDATEMNQNKQGKGGNKNKKQNYQNNDDNN